MVAATLLPDWKAQDLPGMAAQPALELLPLDTIRPAVLLVQATTVTMVTTVAMKTLFMVASIIPKLQTNLILMFLGAVALNMPVSIPRPDLDQVPLDTLQAPLVQAVVLARQGTTQVLPE